MQTKKITQGFTLVELLVVIGILGVLLAITLVAINPGRQFKMANDTKRQADINNIAGALASIRVDNKGSWPTSFTVGSTTVTAHANFSTYINGSNAISQAAFAGTARSATATTDIASYSAAIPTIQQYSEYVCAVLTGAKLGTAGTNVTPQTYIATLPMDPIDGKISNLNATTPLNNVSATTAQPSYCSAGFDTGYQIAQDSTGRVTIYARSELGVANATTRGTATANWDFSASR